MIDIQVHHSAIGLYLDKAQSLSSKGKGRLSFFVESSKKRKAVKKTRCNYAICMQLKGGDIETNPGPTYNLEK